MEREYDNFEIEKVAEYRAADGTLYCEPVRDGGANFATRYFWSVYGHTPGKGVECLCDCESMKDAQYIYDALRAHYLGR